MKNKMDISPRQQQIIIGKLLGDGHLETVNGQTYRLKIEHSLKQKDYVYWLYRELKEIAANSPKIKEQRWRGQKYQKIWFNSRYSGSLRFYGHQFYRQKKKVVPQLIYRWLTPLVIAVWFMDDGSIKSSFHRARIINTQGFKKMDVEKLIAALKRKYDLECKLREQKEGWQIMILSESANKFSQIIRNFIHPSMEYKLLKN